MEDKMMDLLEQLYGEVKTINKRLDNIEQGQADMQIDIKDLKHGQKKADERLDSIESKIDSIQNHLIEMDAKNADRHVVITGEIKDMRKDLAAVEIVTSKNWNEIANLKAVK